MKKFLSNNILYTLLGLILGFWIPIEGWAQLTNPTNSDQQSTARTYKYSARTGALGDATVADASNLSVININPAGLSFVKNLTVAQINIAQNWNNNLMLENFTLPALRVNEHSFAAQFGINHDRGFESLNLLGKNPMIAPKITMYQLDVVYSYSIENVFSIGILNNISYANNPTSQSWTYYPTFGIFYAPSESISYGLTFRGLGQSTAYEVINISRTRLRSQNLRESLELGATLEFPVNTDQNYFSLSLASEKRFGEDNIWYKGGLELTTISHVALRSGLIFQPERKLYAPRFGIGFLTDFIELDYTISHHKGLAERYHQLGLTLNLGISKNS